jgi:hypothetical protein
MAPGMPSKTDVIQKLTDLETVMLGEAEPVNLETKLHCIETVRAKLVPIISNDIYFDGMRAHLQMQDKEYGKILIRRYMIILKNKVRNLLQ